MVEDKPLRVLIADDEPLAAERLQLLLARAEGAQLVGTASDGDLAINLKEALHPDVLLLDIAMPGLDGSALPARSRAGAFAGGRFRYSIRSFRGGRIRGRGGGLSDEAGRAGAASTRPQPGPGLPRARTGQPQAGKASQWLEEFWASDLSGLVRLAAQDVDRVSAERDYMRLHVGRRSWLIDHSMAALEEGFNPDLFVRLHRSAIVRKDSSRASPGTSRAVDRPPGRRLRTARRTSLLRSRAGDRRALRNRPPRVRRRAAVSTGRGSLGSDDHHRCGTADCDSAMPRGRNGFFKGRPRPFDRVAAASVRCGGNRDVPGILKLANDARCERNPPLEDLSPRLGREIEVRIGYPNRIRSCRLRIR